MRNELEVGLRAVIKGGPTLISTYFFSLISTWLSFVATALFSHSCAPNEEIVSFYTFGFYLESGQHSVDQPPST